MLQGRSQASPAPVFLVKSIATTLMKAKVGSSAKKASSPLESDADVWAGLFPDDEEEERSNDSDDDEEDEDDSDAESDDGTVSTEPGVW